MIIRIEKGLIISSRQCSRFNRLVTVGVSNINALSDQSMILGTFYFRKVYTTLVQYALCEFLILIVDFFLPALTVLVMQGIPFLLFTMLRATRSPFLPNNALLQVLSQFPLFDDLVGRGLGQL